MKNLKIIQWWNSCNLKFQDKLTILLLEVAKNNQEAKQLLKLIEGEK